MSKKTGNAPSLADALGEVEAHARSLGARGDLAVKREVVREAAAVTPAALPPRVIEADVHQLVHVPMPKLLGRLRWGCHGNLSPRPALS